MKKYLGLGRLAAGVVVAASVMGATMARADDVTDAQLQAARAAISSLGVTNVFDNILPNLAAQLKMQMIQSYPNLEDTIDKTVDKQAIALAVRRGDLEKEAAMVYAKAFTVDELKSISTFFTSPAGKKLLSDQPIANRELGKAADIWAAGIARDLEKNANEAMQKVAGNQLKAGEMPAAAAPAAQAAPAAPAAGAKPASPAGKLVVPKP